jgi:RNA polymerase sigma-54 factor
MKPRLELRLQQKLIMTPQLQQAIRLLQLSRLELSQTITGELMENPVLEEEVSPEASEDEGATGDEAPSPKTATEAEAEPIERSDTAEGSLDKLEFNWDNYFDQDDFGRSGESEYAKASSEELPSYEQTLTKPVSLEEHLLWQLRLSNVPEDDRRVGEIIIGNLDDDGYLRLDLDELAQTAECPRAKVEQVLGFIHGFDPVGVGARDLRECLMIQIRQLGLQGRWWNPSSTSTCRISRRSATRLLPRPGIPAEEVFQAAKVIEHLEPKPGRPSGPRTTSTSSPTYSW